MAANASIREFAPAKVNLYLHVTGRRDDGYHLLDSLVAFANVGDRLTLTPSGNVALHYTGPFAAHLPTPDRNLVLQAAHRLRDMAEINVGAEIVLEKRLPVASGIGGGSADAAAAIRGLCRLWDIDLKHPKIAELALSLGADVPVCLQNKNCVMQGIGETLSTIENFHSLAAVLVNPGIDVSTPAVFKARSGPFSEPPNTPDVSSPGHLIASLQQTSNDLQEPAVTLSPLIGEVLRALEAIPGITLARMSGSGATCFGLFDNLDVAEKAALLLLDTHPSWWIQPAEIGANA